MGALEMRLPQGTGLDAPRCPLTGEPAIRHIGRFSRVFVELLWFVCHGVRLRDLFSNVRHVDLWESPTGLAFFNPPIAGDARFYSDFYEKDPNLEKYLHDKDDRGDLLWAANKIKPGSKILDVGCGRGIFRDFVPEAEYWGLEPHHPDAGKPDWIFKETLEAHAAAHPGAYDVVVSFHVTEHVVDPLSFVQMMTRLIRPGGQIILACPTWPSIQHGIPNYPMNAPPHHLTWWTEQAFRALCERLGLTDVESATILGGTGHHLVCWMRRFSFIKAREPYYSLSPLWFVSLGIAYALASLAIGMKKELIPMGVTDVVVAARKPAA
jgi:SAM-dependent methyltransferase